MTFWRLFPRCAFALAVLPAALAYAGEWPETLRWTRVGHWDVRIDRTVGNGCYVAAAFESGIGLRIGMNPASGDAWLIIGSLDWGAIAAGKAYELQVRLGRDRFWTVTAEGDRLSGVPILRVALDQPRLFGALSRGDPLHVALEGKEIAALNLSEAPAAVAAMTSCQEAVHEAGLERSGLVPATDQVRGAGRERAADRLR